MSQKPRFKRGRTIIRLGQVYNLGNDPLTVEDMLSLMMHESMPISAVVTVVGKGPITAFKIEYDNTVILFGAEE